MFICMIKGDEFCPDLWIMPERSTRVCMRESMRVCVWTLGVQVPCVLFRNLEILYRICKISCFPPSYYVDPFILKKNLSSLPSIPLLSTKLFLWFLVDSVWWRGSFCSCPPPYPPPPGQSGVEHGLPALYCPLLEGPGSWFPHTDTCPSHSPCRETHALGPCTFIKI